jgi:sugar phosphate isomerase/epimerase
MKKISPTTKKFLTALTILILGVAFLAGRVDSAEKKIVLKKYPGLKIGFTTQNFLRALPVSLENSKKLIDFASDQGFAWIELRDPSASLSLEECKEIAAYARDQKIEVGYAMQIGLLDPSFWEIFSRGLANAACFEGPRTIRTLTCGPEFFTDPKKTAWTLNELYKIVEVANQAANMAKALGLQYGAENALEVIKGDGLTSFGITEFFANVNPNVGWQFDTANFFSASRVWTKPEDARAFLEKFIGKMAYIHLKTSSKEHETLPVLAENELDFDVVFALMVKHKIPYVAIELSQEATLEGCYHNHKKSVEYLLKNY